MIVYKDKNINNKNNGFTIIELLVVVSIMVVLGVIFTNILIDALRGRNKVKAINQVKQNGQVVLDKLSNEIRDADGIVCVDKFHNPGVSPKDTLVITKGGTYTQYKFSSPSAMLNGKIQKINFIRNDLAGDVTDDQLCTEHDETNLNTGSNFIQSLTDADPVNGVSIDYTPPGQDIFDRRGDNVLIKFNASAGVLAGYAYDVTVADNGIPFATSVQVRGGIR
ncbi:MAG: type II secretion system protein [Microgenomates group bacterium]|jgi:prepilin-type N-terminal cleavage/methylation domain-containing protein